MRGLSTLLVVLTLIPVVALGQAPGYHNQARGADGAAVAPGEYFIAQRVVVTNVAAEPLTLDWIDVRRLAGDLEGTSLNRVDVVRADSGVVVGAETSPGTLGRFETGDGVRVACTGNNVIPRGGAVELVIYLGLRATVPQGATVRIASRAGYSIGRDTGITGWAETNPDQTFRVSLFATRNDPDVEDGTVFPGQKFLAQRLIMVNTYAVEVTVDQLVVRNIADQIAGATPLGGGHVAAVEVRRAGDGAVLGQQTSAAPLANLTTTGTVVTTGSNNRVPAFGQVKVEVWITLRANPVPGHRLWLETQVLYTPRVAPPEPVQQARERVRASEAQVFVVGAPGGLDRVDNVPLADTNVYAGQTFLAQRITLRDDDEDPYDVTIESFVVSNVAPADRRLADSHVAKIEVRRASDGAVIGQGTNVTGLSSGGVRIPATANRTVRDDTELAVEVWVTLKAATPTQPIPDGRQIKLATAVWHSEGAVTFDRVAYGNATLTTGPAGRGGLEKAEVLDVRQRPVYLGEQFVMQRLRLEDNDPDIYDVLLESLVIRNNPTTSPLADHHVTRIEVRRASDNALLGATTETSGFSQAGVRISTGTNNRVVDDTAVELIILVTVAPTAATGRRLRLETAVWHTEGATTYPTGVLVGPAEFITKVNEPPLARFTYSPTRDIRWNTTFTFDPSGSTDSDGDVARAKFEWDLGDGTKVIRTGPEIITHRYGKAGRFTVKLTVTDEGGLKAEAAATIDVPENRPPTGVQFSVTPSAPGWSDEVTFTPARGIVDPDGDIAAARFEWDLGDGTTRVTTGPTEVRHLYGKGGEFTVTLTVTDEGGASTAATKRVTITNRPPTGVDFSWEPARPKWSDEVTFTPARGIDDPDGKISSATFDWDFGDGKREFTVGPAPVRYTYRKGGRFTVKLTVTDQGGAKAEKTWVLDVTNAPPTGVDFSWEPEKPLWNEAVTFTPARGIEDPDGDIARATFSWDFGDGTPAVTTLGPASVPHTFGKGGTFTVRLTVIDEGTATGTKEHRLQVTWLTVDFRWEPENPKVGDPMKFIAQVELPPGAGQGGGLTYAWDFGDGNRQEGPNLGEVTHTYAEAGTFTVTLTVTHPNGLGLASHDVTVTPWVVPTVTGLTAVPPVPEVGVEVTFAAPVQAPTDDPVTTWEWDFGDGTPKRTTTAGTAKHTYAASNVFTVTVRARNARGGWSQPRTLSLYVRPKGGALIGTKLLDNPARTQARIQVFLPQGATGVKIQIFDMLGRPVLAADVVGGQYTWNLSDQAGRRIADGLYFYLVTATVAGKTERSEVGRILVVR